eukprot:scaffold86716_cov63-Phaeocystis_antarctica.AAC.2
MIKGVNSEGSRWTHRRNAYRCTASTTQAHRGGCYLHDKHIRDWQLDIVPPKAEAEQQGGDGCCGVAGEERVRERASPIAQRGLDLARRCRRCKERGLDLGTRAAVGDEAGGGCGEEEPTQQWEQPAAPDDARVGGSQHQHQREGPRPAQRLRQACNE